MDKSDITQNVANQILFLLIGWLMVSTGIWQKHLDREKSHIGFESLEHV